MYSIVLEDESDWLLFETTSRNAGTRLLSLCVAVGSHLCRVMRKEAYFVASKKGFSVDSEVVQGSLVACGEAIRSASESMVCALGCGTFVHVSSNAIAYNSHFFLHGAR